ncbi:MAG: UDP-N-acetylglucosamine 1-carboxyvinyltransferase [Bacteroidales bacterium]|nr:UDP-N-acetylglucosamine 1-carboxyvinyltransferase [Bacteroidales bacterium]MDD3151960.1 UDP-N-acetylglucosamine 1-carboxyvinyltransferase [Bacteroidales bacterium]MDD3913963.1 UDP-N-acetylglucosamine 1-carboxyvinyltransferase [Bacteroidales bacterium]MDD4633755.1 UDP-N-acetylglucosamine 1-carboxyvinyltransferase [Bacteroidales bacterium]
MSTFRIVGGRKLHGSIVPQGAKNEALQVICASLLTTEEVVYENVPEILDVNNLLDLVSYLGAYVSRSGDTVKIKAENIEISKMLEPEYALKAGKIRGSVMLMGPLIARFKRAYIYKPGGDKIGRRRLDTHFLGLQKLGANFNFDADTSFITITADKLHGEYMLLDEASVTGTANIIMAAVFADGVTTIFNAACEPYIVQLCKMLVKMGANIVGIGSNLLTITGVSSLNGCKHRLLPDMIEIGSFIGLAALTCSDITIKDVCYDELGLIPTVFSRLGIELQRKGDDLHVPSQEHYEVETFMDGSIMTIADAPWPGFSPDLISIALVTAIQAKGSVLIHQKMFESRLFFVDSLIDMGAQIILCDPHRATVIGHDREMTLRGISMTSPDIRAGVALLLAALSANGTSIIHNVDQIDRGYQYIDKRLIALGASIERI